MKKLALASSIAVLSLGSVTANAEEGQVYINPAIGFMSFDSDFDIDDATLGALGVEYQFHKNWGVEVLGMFGSSEQDILGDVDYSAYRLDGLYYFETMGDFKPYLAAGLGYSELDFDDYDAADEDIFNAGGGVRYLIDEALSARADVRAVHGLNDSFNDMLLTLGLSYAFGGSTPAPEPVPEPEPMPEPEPEPAPEPVKPADSDNDGIIDEQDQCPNTPVGANVDGVGCPLDSDNDGVADYLDKCPDSLPDARVDSKGCKLKKVRVEEIRMNVKFATNSSVVPQSAMAEIKSVADFMTKHEDLLVEIEGHSDSMGKAEYNKMLSQRRADAVATVLTEKYGISKTRVKAIGYGEERPVASNETREGRSENRRVIAVLQKEVEE